MDEMNEDFLPENPDAFIESPVEGEPIIEDLPEFYNFHYITIDDQNRIIEGWSDGPYPSRDTAGAICINEQGGYQFRLFPDGEENPPLWDMDGIPLYKWDGSEVLPRTAEETEADRAAIPDPPPTEQERMEAQVTYTAMMTDTLLEV